MEPNNSSCSPQSQSRKRPNHIEIESSKLLLEAYESIHDQQQNNIFTIQGQILLILIL